MTAPLLLACIGAAFLIQLAIGITIAVRRRRSDPARPLSPAAEAAQPASSGAWEGWRQFRVVRREVEDSTGTQCSFHLEPTDAAPLPPFKPGQFLTFALPVADAAAGAPAGERTVTRCYSLSDRPDPQSYRVTIKRVPAPADRPDLPAGVASNHLHDNVGEGAIVTVKAPSGQFIIDADGQVPAVLIAGGIGITPMMSMLRWCLVEQPQRTIHLYYGVRNGGEHAFKQTLERLAASHPNFRLLVAYSRPGPGDRKDHDFGHAGHVDIDLLKRTLPHGRHRFYVCGPAPMMASLVPALAAWGVAPEDIRHEAFGPASVIPAGGPSEGAAASGAGPVEVRFRRSGRTLAWDGRDASLLDLAERHGIAIESGCRSGSCGSCETRLLSGRVRYAHRPDHDVAPGHCLMCVGTPESPLSLEA